VKLLVLSDLHLERRGGYELPAGTEFDVVVLAGDIHTPGVRGVEWAAKTFGEKPVVYVPGNHEFYDEELTSQLEAMRQAAQGTNVRVLSRTRVVIDGVRFLGATLWTDFALPVAAPDGDAPDSSKRTDIALALKEANLCVRDFQVIAVADPSIPRWEGQDFARRALRAEDTLAMHRVDREWLRNEIDGGSHEPIVVVTHHAPSKKSVARKFATSWVTPAFVSDLPDELFAGTQPWLGGPARRGGPELWVHGHTHSQFDYEVAGCRVVSNPRGYRLQDSSWENAQFNPGLVVEVEKV
jgi:predicted phosphodiesterase